MPVAGDGDGEAAGVLSLAAAWTPGMRAPAWNSTAVPSTYRVMWRCIERYAEGGKVKEGAGASLSHTGAGADATRLYEQKWEACPLLLTVNTAVRFCTASPVVMHWPAGMEVGAPAPCAGSEQPPDWLGGHSVQNSQAALAWHCEAHSSALFTVALPNRSTAR